MRTVIFGYAGFVGPHLEDVLSETEDVYGFDLKNNDDMTDYNQVRTFLDAFKPDYIYNLAALSYIGESQMDPQRAVDVHIKGTLNVLEAVKNLGLRCRIHLASSSEEYGYDNQKAEVTEESPTYPSNIYAITKNAMTNIGLDYIKRHKMEIIITRAFNHLGAGKGPQFAETSFARQIALIERGQLDRVYHGNLSAVRNYTDVHDIVHAYQLLMLKADPGVYNVCSDKNVELGDLLELMSMQSEAEIRTEVDQTLYKESGEAWHNPSCKKLKDATGWEPHIPLEESLRYVLQDWRQRVL